MKTDPSQTKLTQKQKKMVTCMAYSFGPLPLLKQFFQYKYKPTSTNLKFLTVILRVKRERLPKKKRDREIKQLTFQANRMSPKEKI